MAESSLQAGTGPQREGGLGPRWAVESGHVGQNPVRLRTRGLEQTKSLNFSRSRLSYLQNGTDNKSHLEGRCGAR